MKSLPRVTSLPAKEKTKLAEEPMIPIPSRTICGMAKICYNGAQKALSWEKDRNRDVNYKLLWHVGLALNQAFSIESTLSMF
ncbi:hypothetical protein [uncultured Acetatifactor sp.]|uniref:hypothetical protein n=1 Tax=uncultured Acetatifactor sp. TaxID=1671927 RepID=UPI0026036B28|nr:hypothetical protein [uncultured Acetatifactor sp.]